MRKAIKPILLLLFCLLSILGCEGINVWQATDAGKDAVKAITLSEEDVQKLAQRAALKADNEHKVAQPKSPYANRLQRLIDEHRKHKGHSYNYKAYCPQGERFRHG